MPPVFLDETSPANTDNNNPLSVSASGSAPGQPAWRGFDHGNDFWQSQSGQLAGWLQVDFGAGNEKTIVHYAVTATTASDSPADFALQGSQNGVDWAGLDSQTGQTWPSPYTDTYLGFILDVSGSMATGGKLNDLKTACNAFVDAYVPLGQKIGIISFASSATIRSGFTDDASQLHDVINGLTAGGQTNYIDALEKTRTLFASAPAGMRKVAFFISDGVPTISPGAAQIQEVANADILLHAIGDQVPSGGSAEAQMRRLSDGTGGLYEPATSLATLQNALNNTYDVVTRFYYNLPNAVAYRYYRLDITANNGNGDHVSLAELRLSENQDSDESTSSFSTSESISSQSESSPSSSSFSSSSTFLANTYLLDSLRYLSACQDVHAIAHPAQGGSVRMFAIGHWEPSAPSYAPAFDGDRIHLERGGLRRTRQGRGAFVCRDASRLFSLASGTVSLRLQLPQAVVNGVYQPLSGGANRTLTDYVLWMVNPGAHYVTQPGFYAALTPAGIEFTVWTAAGRHTLLDQTTNLAAGIDCVLEFSWKAERHPVDEGASMAIFVNGQRTAALEGAIADPGESSSSLDPLHNLYVIDTGAAQRRRSAAFWMLDTPHGDSGLDCVVRRIEIYAGVPPRLAATVDLSSSSSASSSSASSFSSSSRSSSSSSSSFTSSSSTVQSLTSSSSSSTVSTSSSSSSTESSSSSTWLSESSSSTSSTSSSSTSSSSASSSSSTSSSSTSSSHSSPSSSSTLASLSSSSTSTPSSTSSSSSRTLVVGTVPAATDIWLAGMPGGSMLGGDNAPDHTPVLILSQAMGGKTLRCTATGLVADGGVANVAADGDYVIAPPANNGMAGVTAPVLSLVGVFLDDDQPDSSGAPGGLDFAGVSQRDYLTLSPALKQVFFWGDGRTSADVEQEVIAPAGTTRLYLAVLDSPGESHDNSGSFDVTLTHD